MEKAIKVFERMPATSELISVMLKLGTADKPSEIVTAELLPISDGTLPELRMMIGCGQNHHHTHDVFGHTMAVLDATPKDLVLRIAALLHDSGKVYTRKVEADGRVTFHGHEEVSARIALAALKSFTDLGPLGIDLAERTAFLCDNHMKLKAAGDFGTGMSNKSLQRLKAKAPSAMAFEQLLQLCHADNVSHAPDSCMPNQVKNLRRIYDEIGDYVPRNVHAKPVGAMFDEFMSHEPTQFRTRHLVKTSKGMVHQRVDMVVGLIVDYIQTESENYFIKGEEAENYSKAFRSRAEKYVNDLLA